MYESERPERLAERDKEATLGTSATTKGVALPFIAYTRVPGNQPGRFRFLQFQTDDMHIYFSGKVIRKACQNGLDTLVADGIFSMHPCQREKNGQLYTIHGVYNER
ncbi:unnamed protein product [Heligmosomoides polygyrus]|uniref:Uncharacterized protein n=1 Tax=Heligmosomoides polygyrus TaxID=6339 RepID=A0A3P7UQQ8_HELPZ|nr:unnamed protein product [Heligmosomoides polygyrus]